MWVEKVTCSRVEVFGKFLEFVYQNKLLGVIFYLKQVLGEFRLKGVNLRNFKLYQKVGNLD